MGCYFWAIEGCWWAHRRRLEARTCCFTECDLLLLCFSQCVLRLPCRFALPLCAVFLWLSGGVISFQAAKPGFLFHSLSAKEPAIPKAMVG